MRYMVITGGPGFGKTSIIRALRQKDYACGEEIARNVIRKLQKQEETQLLPWVDRNAFEKVLLEEKVKEYERFTKQHKIVFFDRGFPDAVAYYKRDAAYPFTECIEACLRYRYNAVFVTPSWKEIFVNDDQRKESFKEAAKTHQYILQTYRDFGYEPIEIPLDTVKNRVKFVLTKSKIIRK